MSTKRKGRAQGVIGTGDSSAPPTTPTPTVTYYQQVAERFLTALAEIVQIIPELEAPHALTSKFVRTHLNLPRPFLATAVAAVEEHPTLQAVQKLDVTDARNKLQYIEAFGPVLDKVETFSKKLRFTVDSQEAALATQCLQIYDVSKGLSRDANSADIQALVKIMKRDLGKRGRPRRAASESRQKPEPWANTART